MDEEQFRVFCKELLNLKEKLQCPICLDFIDEHAELECGHRFCKKCITKYKGNKDCSCPICKVLVKRRSTFYKDDFADRISSLISAFCGDVEENNLFSIEILAANNGNKLTKTKVNTFSKQPSTSRIIDNPQIEIVDLDDEEPHKTKGKLKNSKGKIKNKVSEQLTKDKIFKELLNKPRKLRPKNTQNNEVKYKILDFNDITTKNAVVHWLNDNRNKFDRLTQTQNIYEETNSENNLTMELPSVSQVTASRGKPPPIRSRSLDLEVKQKEKKLENSITGIENYSIEEINTEDIVNKAAENVLLNIMENTYLDNMETSVEKKPDLEKKPPLTTQSSSSGWERVQNVKKTLQIKEKVPKKLKVTVKNSQNSSRNKNSLEKENASKIDGSKDEVKPSPNSNKKNNSLEKENIFKKDHSRNKKQENSIRKSKSFQQVLEEVLDANKSANVDQLPLDSKLEATNEEKDQSKSTSPQKVSGDDLDGNKSTNDDQLLSDSKLNVTNEKKGGTKSKSPRKISEEFFDDNKSTKIEQLPPDFDNIEENIKINKNEKNNQQKIVILEQIIVKAEKEEKEEEEDDPYSLPTQKLENSDQLMEIDDVLDEIDFPNDFNGVMTRLVNDLDENSDKKLTKRHLKSYLNKLNDLYAILSDKFEQTKKIVIDSGVQTEVVNRFNVEVQTSNDSDGIDCSKIKNDVPKVVQQNEYFAATLDMINFETQEIERQYKLQRDQKMLSKSVKANLGVENKKQNDNLLECSLKSDVAQQKSQNLKRNLSDSDSSDVVAMPKRRCNRFVRDDLSVEFGLSENTKKKNSFSTGLTIESDEENNEDYLDELMKKFKTADRSNTEHVDMDLDMDIVNRVNENITKLSTKPLENNPNSELDDNLFLDDQDLSKIDNEVNEQLKHVKETESFDIISESESIEPRPKKNKKKKPDVKNDSPIKASKGTYCQELEDSFEVMVVENVEKKLGNEEDLFSEDDYVETTPEQKERPATQRKSQSNAVVDLTNRFPAIDEVDKEIIDNFDENFAPLSPPPGFEDQTAPEEITVIDLQEKQPELDDFPHELFKTRATTPELQSVEGNKVTYTPRGVSSIALDKLLHSTPLTQSNFPKNSLGLSPIVQEKSAFEKALNSNVLTSSAASEETPRKRNLLTSLPRQKSILNYVKPSQTANKQKPCIACTRLSKDQIQSVSLLTNKKLATYSAKFTDSVSHMIVTVDDRGRIKDYTMKFVSAVAAGLWIVGFEWIQECLRTNSIVPEEPYEVLDDSGNCGPKMARLSRLERPLFKNYRFYCVSPFYSTTVDDVEGVIVSLGGVVVKNLENLKQNDGKISLIITEGRSTQDFEIYEKWLEKFKVATVDIEWLSRSVGRYKILSIRPYVWCTDDNIEDLGYPYQLVENTSTSSF